MASAVAVFRDNAIEKDRLEKQTDADRALSESERLERERQKAEDAANTKFAVDALRGGLEALCWHPGMQPAGRDTDVDRYRI